MKSWNLTKPLLTGLLGLLLSWGSLHAASPGALDSAFTPGTGFNSSVADLVIQSDGKLVVGGAFVTFNGVSRLRIARLNADGSLDSSFDPGGGFNDQVKSLAIQPDGRILVSGQFSRYDGLIVGRLLRLNQDGSRDLTFNSGTAANSRVDRILRLANGKFLIVGTFTQYNGNSAIRIARLNSDGSYDNTFNVPGGMNSTAADLVEQSDGKVIVAGAFSSIGGVGRARIARLNTDGSVDTSFVVGSGANGNVNAIELQSNGKVILGGRFSNVGGSTYRKVARLNSDGSVDTSFHSAIFSSDVDSLLVQSDDEILVGGVFTSIDSVNRGRFARLNADGSLDTVFVTQPGASGRVKTIRLNATGGIFIGGDFTSYDSASRNRVAAVGNDLAVIPIITQQPIGATVTVGQTVTLTVVATGQGLSYQWTKDGVNVAGATSSTLNINNAATADSGAYAVVVSNSNGSVTSADAVVSVLPNAAPTINAVSDAAINEDAGAQTVHLTGIGAGAAHESGQTLSISATSGDTAIIATPTISYTSPDSAATLTYTPLANANGGPVTLSVTVADDGGTAEGGDHSTTIQFTVTVNAVNDPPTVTVNTATHIVNEDAAAQTVNGAVTFATGPANESSQTFTINISNNNSSLFSVQPALDASGNLTYTPAANANGAATVTVSITDNGGGADTSASQTLTINVNPVNDAPDLTLTGNVTVAADSGTTTQNIVQSFSPGPANESSQAVDDYIVSHDNLSLFTSPPDIANNGQLSFTAAAGQNGLANVTVQVRDNGGTANGGVDTSVARTFTITVGVLNQPPTFDLTSTALNLNEDAGAQTHANFVSNITPGVGESASGQTVTFTIANDNNALFSSQPALSGNQLTFTPAADAHGTAVVSITGTDDGPLVGGNPVSATKTVTITVAAVNDEPSFALDLGLLHGTAPVSGLPAFVVAEDAAAQTVSTLAVDLNAGAANESSQTLSFAVIAADPSLFSAGPAIDASGNLTFTPAAHANGESTITVTLSDNGGTANGGDDTAPVQSFGIVITSINDAPTVNFNHAELTVDISVGAQSQSSFASISLGPANEASQTVTTFTVVNNNNGLFSVQPAIDQNNGNLTFTPSGALAGTATVTVTIQDNGGTANGGVDQVQATFTITIAVINNPPTFDLNPALLTTSMLVGPENAGPLHAWGINGNGSLGDGANTDRNRPNQVLDFTRVILATGGNGEHSLAIQNDNTLWSWGNNDYGQLGNGSTGGSANSPARINGLANVRDASAGDKHSLAALGDGTVYSWGADSDGQLGDGTIGVTVNTPTQIPGLSGITKVAAGEFFSLALNESGNVLAWGDNSAGQLGNGTSGASDSPTPSQISGLNNIIAIAAGAFHALALDGSGNVYAWGDNDNGQCGAGAIGGVQTTPAPVAGLANIVAIAAGADHSIAVDNSGNVHTFGDNSFGQLGNNSNTDSASPVQVSGLSGIDAVAAGGFHSLARKTDGTAHAWGDGFFGQLGDNANTGALQPVPVLDLSNVIAVGAGDSHSFAIVSGRRTVNGYAALEDAGAVSVANFAINIDAGSAVEAGQTVSFTVVNDNSALFAVPPAIDSHGTLTFTPAANAVGAAGIEVYATDNGGTANGGNDRSATIVAGIEIQPVNDAPSFHLNISNVESFRGEPQQTVAGITAIVVPGPTDESGQNVTFTTSNDNNALFSVQPAVTPNGALTFTPAANGTGAATVSITAVDDGGTANGGQDTSTAKTFTIRLPATRVRVDNYSGGPGDTVTLSLSIDSAGTESGVAASLNYDADVLTFVNAAPGADASGATVVVNTSQTDQGRVGLLATMPLGAALAAGDRQLVRVTFNVSSGATVGSTALTLGDTPIRREVSDASASILTDLVYQNGAFSVVIGTQEADVGPRPNGNGSITVLDAIQVSRFAAGLDIAVNGNEFQKADCAPIATFGDGRISLADWIQALRYASNLDAPNAAAGPMEPIAALHANTLASRSSRSLNVSHSVVAAGGAGTITVNLSASGGENGAAFTLAFDPSQAAFGGIESAGSATLVVNDQARADGRIGVMLALPAGAVFTAGDHQLVRVHFRALHSGQGLVTLVDSPVEREIADPLGHRLPASYAAGSFGVRLPPQFKLVGDQQLVFGNTDGSPVTPAQLAGLEVLVSSDLSRWSRLDNALRVEDGRVRIVDDSREGIRFYQIRRSASPAR